VSASSPLAVTTRLHLEEGTEVLGVPIHNPLLPPGIAEGEVRPHMCRGGGHRGYPERPRAHAALLGTGKGTVRNCLSTANYNRNLPLHHTAVLAADVPATQRATWDAVVGTPTSDASWVPITLPMREGGCGVASAVDVAPVERLAGVMQFLALAELMLGCDRKLVVLLTTEAGLLDALNARLLPALEPLASCPGRVRWNCPTGTSGASTGGHPG